MAHITRSDGLQFVIQAYRELLPPGKRAQLIRDIRSVADQQGNYLFLAKKPSGQIEVVYSNETGYLLGESVWNYFAKPDNLIFVEELPENDQVILVVIREGTVYLDVKIGKADVRTELIPLMAGSQKYQIRVYGHVNLNFPNDLTESSELLKRSVFNQLKPGPELILKPLMIALKSKILGTNFIPFLTAAIVIAVVFGGWWTIRSQVPRVVHQQNVMIHASNPYADYQQALATEPPSQQLENMAGLVQKLYFIPGWKVDRILWQQKKYQVFLESDGGDLETLIAWSKENKFRVEITGNGVRLMRIVQLQNRQEPRKIYATQQVIMLLIDELDQLLHARSVQLGESETYGEAKKTPFSINLKQATPEVLSLIAKQLDNLPLALLSIDLRFNDGLIDGTIQLSVWGR